VFGDARRRKHWTDRREGSAQRGARAERVGAFRLSAVAVPVVPAEAFRLFAVAAAGPVAFTLFAVAAFSSRTITPPPVRGVKRIEA
jgi:hypothetical protein